ncbi:MAG: hypothetical protein IKY26_03180 [Erysipelotrichaceae bacterium]|nr:hypothetical protein [Erysipelotrichaceae bacterium]
MFNFMMIVPLLIFGAVFVFMMFNMVGMFTGRTQKRMMNHAMKTMKTMTDGLTDGNGGMSNNLKDMVTNLTEMQKDLYEEHGESFKDLARMQGEVEAEKTRAKAQAVKDVFGSDTKVDPSMFAGTTKKITCKNCGSLVDSDSMYCKICGKRPF